MKEIKLLDCTLRDGGYINDWHFGKKAIDGTIELLEESNVDILELGFLKDEPYNQNRTVFNDMNQISDLILPKKDNVKYAAMIEVVNPIPLNKITPCSKDTVDIIRVIVWKTKHDKDGNTVDALQEGFEYCKGIVEKGYKLCVQPARVDQYSDEEFINMCKLFNQLKPLALYIVDSWGTQSKEDLLPYLKLADKNLDKDIALGFHGHNNKMQAFETSKDFCIQKMDRTLFIDGSVYGIGRGAGNLNIELFAQWMNENYKTNYNTTPLVKIYDKYIKQIRTIHNWGYSVAHLLTANVNCNPGYADYYGNELHIADSDIEGILKTLSSEDKIIFTKPKAKKYLKEYRKSQLNLAVIIPTCNRSNSIDYWLYIAAGKFWYYGIDIIIYDSSSNDATEAVCKNFQIDGFDNIIYKRYTGKFDGFSLDDKVISAYKEFVSSYEYLWVCRDGLLINIDKIYSDLKEISDKKYNLISVNASFRKKNIKVKKVYSCPNDAVDFLRENFVDTLTLGTFIFSAKFVNKILNDYPLNDTNYSLWQNIVPYYYVANNIDDVFMYIDDVFMYNIAGTRSSFWNKSGNSMKQWAYYYPHIINQLPEIYNRVKKDVIKIQMFDFKPFSPGSLIRMRGNGGLSIRHIRKYRKNFPLICDTPLWQFYAIAFMPKHFARWLLQNQNSVIFKGMSVMYRYFIK